MIMNGFGYAVVATDGRMVALTARHVDNEVPSLLAHFDSINPHGAPHRVARMAETDEDSQSLTPWMRGALQAMRNARGAWADEGDVPNEIVAQVIFDAITAICGPMEREQVKEADGEQAIRRLMEATFSTWPNELVSWKKAAVLEFGRAVWREAIGAPQRTMGCIGCGSSDADCDCDEAGEG